MPSIIYLVVSSINYIIICLIVGGERYIIIFIWSTAGMEAVLLLSANDFRALRFRAAQNNARSTGTQVYNIITLRYGKLPRCCT